MHGSRFNTNTNIIFLNFKFNTSLISIKLQKPLAKSCCVNFSSTNVLQDAAHVLHCRIMISHQSADGVFDEVCEFIIRIHVGREELGLCIAD